MNAMAKAAAAMRTLAAVAALAAAMPVGSADCAATARRFTTPASAAPTTPRISQAHPGPAGHGDAGLLPGVRGQSLGGRLLHAARRQEIRASAATATTKIEGGFLCDVCANDSCEPDGETFKVLWSGRATACDLVNDTTGVAGAGRRAAAATASTAGGEHGVVPARRAGATSEDCDLVGRSSARMNITAAGLQGERPARARRPAAAAGAEPRPAAISSRSAPQAAAALPEFEQLRERRGRSRTTRSPISTSTSRPTRRG